MRVEQRADLGLVAIEQIGAALKRRREKIGLDVAELAREAHVSRTTIYDLEEGRTKKPHAKKLAAIQRALDEAEEETFGVSAEVSKPESTIEQIVVVVDGDRVEVTVNGPIRDPEELEASVAKIVRGIRDSASDAP